MTSTNPQSTGFYLAYLLSYSLAPVQEQLLSYLEPTELLALPLICYNINARLRKFFPDPTAFRKLQGQTGALIEDDFARPLFKNLATRLA
ncbi:hypothetical protein EJ02DRAFT_426610 [Clathrospora elynae]|uniref:Uncharacterized protein n=1 Tax=Clathrospora elynae TaxID=706981 RepID=A0A6A5SCP1_9PLEO|nr:hypothetical protein EJ02DRAFT_426610 [Clathrospora elynae]